MCAGGAIQAQKVSNEFKDEFVRAEYLFFDKQYPQALEKYKELYETDSTNHNLAFRIGACYMEENMYFKAIKHLEFAKESMKKKYKIGSYKQRAASYDVLYLLGKAYQIVREYKKAKLYYQRYDSVISVKNVYMHDINKAQIKACDRAEEMVKSPVKVEINNIGRKINSDKFEMNPLVSANDSVMVFARKSFEEKGFGIHKYYVAKYSIHTAKRTKKGWKEDGEITKSVGSRGYFIPVSLSADAQTLVLFRDNFEYGSINDNDDGALYYSENKNGRWTAVKKFDSNINKTSWEGSGCLSSDGNSFYFSSTQKGGFGLLDIYVCEKANEEWGKAQNLGSSINTNLNEQNPILVNDSTLYFVSESHDNMGGFDVFISKKIGAKWSKPVNVGYPINSSSDDMILSPSNEGTKAYFSTYRPDGFLTFGKSDIYSVVFIKEAEKLKEEEIAKEEKEELLALDSAKIGADSTEIAKIDKQIEKLEKKIAKIEEKEGMKEAIAKEEKEELVALNTAKIDADSEETEKLNQQIAQLEEKIAMLEEKAEEREIKKKKKRKEISVFVEEPEEEIASTDDYSPQKTVIEGTVESSVYGDIHKPVDVKMVDLSNNETVAHIQADDENETYEIEAEPGEYKLIVETEGHSVEEHAVYIPNTTTANVKIESKLDPTNKTGDDFYLIKPVFFEYGSTELSREAKFDLERLYLAMKQDKTLYLEVVGHTDKTSSYQFNKKLSLKRAKAVTSYLIDAGIDPVRFVQRGMSYDENIASNDTEEGRRFNRRVDMRIVKSGGDNVAVQDITVPQHLRQTSNKGEFFVLVELEDETNSDRLQNLVSSGKVGGQTVSFNNQFYFYAGVFSKKSEALVTQNKLISEGFDEAEIVGNDRIYEINRSNKNNEYKGSYTIQLLALKEPCDIKRKFKSISDVEELECNDGYYRYITGQFSSLDEAVKAQDEITTVWEKGSFIVRTERFEDNAFVNRKENPFE